MTPKTERLIVGLLCPRRSKLCVLAAAFMSRESSRVQGVPGAEELAVPDP
jgi:hypothetical protein